MPEKIDNSRLDLTNYQIRLTLETQFSDMDALGHLNNIAIARMYESARARFHMKAFGYYKEKMPTPGQGAVVLVQADLRYLAEGFFPKPVVVATKVANIGNSSYTLHQALFQDDQCIGLCDASLVYVKASKSHALTEKMRKALQATSVVNSPE